MNKLLAALIIARRERISSTLERVRRRAAILMNEKGGFGATIAASPVIQDYVFEEAPVDFNAGDTPVRSIAAGAAI
jgi:hypothetical protein